MHDEVPLRGTSADRPGRVSRSGRHAGRGPAGAALVVAVFAAMLTACGGTAATAASGPQKLQIPQSPPLATAAVGRGTVTDTARLTTGQIVSTHTADLYFHNAGTVATVDAADGQSVGAGQLLAALDSGSLSDQIAAAELGVQRDRLQLAATQASVGVPTSPLAAETALVTLRQAQLTLQRDELALADQRLTLSEDEVRASFAGIVNDVSVAPGDQVGSFQTVMVLSDPQALEYQATVSQSTAAVLHPGQTAQVMLGTSASRSWPAVVKAVNIPSLQAVAQAAANSNGTVVLLPTVTFAVRRPSGGLSIGERFTAVVTLAEAKNALYVPSDAIRSFGGSTYVDVLTRGVVAEVPVATGIRGGTVTQVTRGLKAGETVVEP